MTEAPIDPATATSRVSQLVGDPAMRVAANAAAREMLLDLVGSDVDDTTLRVATDHLVSFARTFMRESRSRDSAIAATARLLDLAQSDTGQARRVADFLMAWWNGPDLGKFDIADIFAVDQAIAADMATVIAFLGKQAGAVYPDRLGFHDEMQKVIARWRNLETPPA